MNSTPSIVTDYNSFVFAPVPSRSASTIPSEENNNVDSPSENRSGISSHPINSNPINTYTPYGRIAEIGFWRVPTQHHTSNPLKENVEREGRTKETSAEVKKDTYQKTGRVDEGDRQRKLGIKELTNHEKAEVKELQKTDREVKMHEMAHLAAGGQYAGGASYAYKTGPDGRQYTVGGEVPIDVSEERDSEKTVQKMAQVKRAALAPADPSAADRAIAAKAAQIMAQARLEMIQQQMEERQARAEAVSPSEVAKSIKSYKRHEESMGLNGNYNETNPTSPSPNTITEGIEKLKNNQIMGKAINLFS